MKKKIIHIICILTTSLMSSIELKAQFIKAELQASGLTCSMCSLATQKQLKTLDFIDSIGTDLNHTTFLLYFKKDKTVDIDKIKKKVEDAGFSVAELKIVYHFENTKVENNFHLEYQHNLYHFMNASPQTLNGNITLRIIDRGFISEKEYKKHLKETILPCYQTGKMPDVNRVYHVTIAP